LNSRRQGKDTRPFPPQVLRKALTLVENHGVSKISEGVYSVRSEHWGRKFGGQTHYMVEKITSDKWNCMCPGFKRRGICSHVVAVMVHESKKTEASKS